MTSPATNPGGSPFHKDKSPSVTFPTPGTTRVLTIIEWPSFKESHNFETGAIERWEDGSVKKIILVPCTLDGAQAALWVKPGTALFAAVEAAQQAAGTDIGPGGTLSVTYTHDVPSAKGAHFAPAKQYSATYSPASAFAKQPDGFNTEPVPPHAPPSAPPVDVPLPVPATPTADGKTRISAEQFAALAAAGVPMDAFAVSA